MPEPARLHAGELDVILHPLPRLFRRRLHHLRQPAETLHS
jgi:hypothetical protein